MRSRVLLAVLLAAPALLHCNDDEGLSLAQKLPPSGAGSGGAAGAAAGGAGSGGYLGVDPEELLGAPKSCAYRCNGVCNEDKTPYACPALTPWGLLPHLDTCPSWDEKYPEVKAGACKATAPTGMALLRPSGTPGAGQPVVLPDGRTSLLASDGWVFPEAGSMATSATAIPGTSLVLVLDTGKARHSVRLVDRSKIGDGDPVLQRVLFEPDEELNGTLVYVPPSRVYVAASYGVVQALSLDVDKRTLARDDASSLAMPSGKKPWFSSAVAVSPDGRRLVATPVAETLAQIFDVDPESATYKQRLGEVKTGSETFAVAFDPGDKAGTHAYVTLWDKGGLLDLDLSDPTSPVVAHSYDTGKNPQGMAFLDPRWMAVANDFGETISLVDRVAQQVTQVPVEVEPGLRGLDLSGLTWDAPRKRLWAVLSGLNALAAYDVDLAGSTPKLTPAGKLPTAWWPSAVAVHDDGSLTVTTMRGRGTGPYLQAFAAGSGNGDKEVRGSVHRVEAPSADQLSEGEKSVQTSAAVGARPGYPAIDCPPGQSDFPVPATNTEGPSGKIKRIIFIVRENKTFDALLGDMPGLDGDPAYTLKETSADMDRVWPNFRQVVREFATADNYYNLALESSMGHQWTTFGRDSDFCERTFATDSRTVPLCGVGGPGRPAEGSLFDWLQRSNVPYTLLGEIVGNPEKLPPGPSPIDIHYPGGPFQNIGYNDDEKACYMAGRLRIGCNLGNFVYMTLPNDHTIGINPKNPSPETMCAVNDEATGMVVDAISHSPFWAESLVVITEDDPQQGGDHVDYHRVPIAIASPWVKRGYVSKTLFDVASLHKIFAHVLGLPYPNASVKNAGLPLDLFTSTPDYTPYTYAPRRWPLQCGVEATRAESELTSSWDFNEVDAQAGLGDQVARWMRRRQLHELTPELRREVDARLQRRALGLPPPRDEDDDD